MAKLRVTIWNECEDERSNPEVLAMYPGGVHGALQDFLAKNDDLEVRTATFFDGPDQGLPPELIDSTDVMVWFSHMLPDDVKDETVAHIIDRVHAGMGLVLLHSSLGCQLSRQLLGTGCCYKYREAGEKERVWVVDRGHPVASDLGESFLIPESEMYGEPADIATPDELVFISWFEGGDVHRSGCAWRRGAGKVFYFSPGHATYPILYQPEYQQVVTNAVRWATPPVCPPQRLKGEVEPLEVLGHE